jgi:hypothetical protein
VLKIATADTGKRISHTEIWVLTKSGDQEDLSGTIMRVPVGTVVEVPTGTRMIVPERSS